MTNLSTTAAPRRASWLTVSGLALLLAVRILTMPRSLWEFDEMLFAGAVLRFDPLHHWPHPPGYPLLVGLGKVLNFMIGDAFVSLAALSLVSSLAGYLALCAAFRRLLGAGAQAEVAAVAAALLFHLSPAMLVQAPLALSDAPALMFVSFALAAAAILWQEDGSASAWMLGLSASAAIGCRPQLALAVLPMLAVALWRPSNRRRLEALAAFAITSLVWLVPLIVATGGLRGFLHYELGQAAYVAGHDAGFSRLGATLPRLVARFVSHAWGSKWLAAPVLAAALVGAFDMARRRRFEALPLAALCGAQLAACLALMDPADAVRYALPWMLGVALAATAGAAAATRRLRFAAWAPLALTGVVVGAGAAEAWPVLAARFESASPPALAAEWAVGHVPHGATILSEPDMAAHARYLLRDYDVAPVDGGLDRAAAHPDVPVYLLSEGDSGREGAMTFRWPDSDAYHRLTRNHYRVVSLTPLQPGFVQAVRGVYPWEPSALDARWRWLERAATLRVFPRGATGIVLTLGLPATAGIDDNQVTVIAGGATVATIGLSRGESRRVEIAVDRPGPLFVGIRAARSFVPASADRRELALQLLEVERVEGARP
jgi:dolichyl-phosphate-mannose-protein mannosyltransferase